MANTPEELEQIRAYGQALMNSGQAPDPALVSGNPYAMVSPFSLITRGLNAVQGRSALDFVESERRRTRRERAAAIPGVGTAITPPPVTPSAPPVSPLSAAPDAQQPGTRQASSGLHPRYVDTLIQIESSGDRNISVANGRRVPENQARYFGLGQFSRDLLQRYGVTDWRDEAQQRRAIEQHAASNSQAYTQRFGKEPSPGELYLMHQQGAGGAIALLSNPNETAFDTLMRLPYYGGDASRVQSAIQNNLPGSMRRNWRTITSGEFANQWINRFTQRMGPSAPVVAGVTAGSSIETGAVNPPMRLGAGDVSPPGGIQENALPPATMPQNPPAQNPPAAPAPQAEAPQGEGEFQTAQAPAIPPPPGSTPPNYIGGRPRDIPPGVPQRIPPNPQLQMIINQLRNPNNLSGDEFNSMLKEYQTLSAPQSVETPFGLATYNPGTGELMSFVPRAVNRQVTYPGGSSNQHLIWHNGQLRVVPIGPMNAPPGGGAPGGGAPGGAPGGALGGAPGGVGNPPNPNISPTGGLPFPQTGDVAEESAWGQRQQSLGVIAAELARGQAGRINTAMTQGTQASERIPMLNAIRTATQAVANNRVSGEAVSRLQTVIGQYFRNFGPIPNGPMNDTQYREFLDKLNAFLASEATQEISARGTNFEFATLLRYNPNLFSTHEGAMILIDYLMQEKKKQEAIGNMAANLRPEEAGDFNARIERYNRTHPIYINVPASGPTPAMRITTQHIPQVGELKPDMTGTYTEDEVRAVLGGLPRGVWFINPRTGLPTPTVPPPVRASASAR